MYHAEALEQALRLFFADAGRGGSHRLNYCRQIRLGCRKFVAHFLDKCLKFLSESGNIGCGHGHRGMCLTRNGVVQASGLNIAKAQIGFLALFPEETHQQLVGIRTLLVDIVARVSAGKAFHHEIECRKAFGQLLFVYGVSRFGAYTPGAAHKELSFVFRIQVDQIISRHESGFHLESPRQSRFLIAREHAFDRSVFDIIGFQQRHLHGNADTVVGTERCALCLEPIAVHVGLNGVVVKVKFYVFVLFADHVLVALQNHGFAIFKAGCSGFANQDVAGLVDQRFKTEILTKFAKERSYLFLAL